MPILIKVSTQELQLNNEKHECIKTYPISTAAKGVGEEEGSEQTPRGLHIIRAKIGDGCPINTVFRGRRPTGEIYQPGMDVQRDWILTRILWLSGLEVGLNRLGNVDTMRRYIYIHGTADELGIGQARSKGCIRMRNSDVLDLFDRVSIGETVMIVE